jgi:hypothetical protein
MVIKIQTIFLTKFWLFSIRLRLVMPPPLFFVLQLPFTQLAYVLFPVAMANGIIAGSFTFCQWHLNLVFQFNLSHPLFYSDIGYDCMHYAQVNFYLTHLPSLTPSPRLHHTKLPQYMREMKKYHLAHHYKNFELGYGVTSEYSSYPSGGLVYVFLEFFRQDLGLCLRDGSQGVKLGTSSAYICFALLKSLF